MPAGFLGTVPATSGDGGIARDAPPYVRRPSVIRPACARADDSKIAYCCLNQTS